MYDLPLQTNLKGRKALLLIENQLMIDLRLRSLLNITIISVDSYCTVYNIIIVVTYQFLGVFDDWEKEVYSIPGLKKGEQQKNMPE